MTDIYEEVEIEDLLYDAENNIYTYPCPCGDTFHVTLEELWEGDDIARCPSCTLRIKIIFDESDLPPLPMDGSDNVDSHDGNTSVGDDILYSTLDSLEKLSVKDEKNCGPEIESTG
jgi:diphthamide biosynthesis protein 3